MAYTLHPPLPHGLSTFLLGGWDILLTYLFTCGVVPHGPGRASQGTSGPGWSRSHLSSLKGPFSLQRVASGALSVSCTLSGLCKKKEEDGRIFGISLEPLQLMFVYFLFYFFLCISVSLIFLSQINRRFQTINDAQLKGSF
jgi:hypothetical protein